MKKELVKLFNNLKANGRIFQFDETRVKQAIVLQVLYSLGWDTFNVDEVFPDFPIPGGEVDFSLRYNDENYVFVMVKHPGDDMTKFERSFLEAARNLGVRIAVITNGVEWQFFVPSRETEIEKTKFQNLQILEHSAKVLANKFIDFLSRDRILKGKALVNAKKVFKSRKKKKLIKDALTKTLNGIIGGEETAINQIIALSAETISSYPIESEDVSFFFKSLLKVPRVKRAKEKAKFPPEKTEKKPAERKKIRIRGKVKTKGIRERKKAEKVAEKEKEAEKKVEKREPVPGNRAFIGKKPRLITFLGRPIEIKKWKEVLTNVCNILAIVRKRDFENVLSLHGRKRLYFSRSSESLKEPRLVSGTDIFVETNFNASNLYTITLKVLKSFGYSERDIVIETR